jgi:cytochrome P450
MKEALLSSFEDAGDALRNPNLAQSMYDAGAVVMDKVLLTLHGEEHRARRLLEFRVFRKNFFAYYEREVFPKTLHATLAPYLAAGRANLIEFGYRVTMNLTADFAGIDRPAGTVEETEGLYQMVKTFSEGATLVHSKRNPRAVEAEVRAALVSLQHRFLNPSVARRQALLSRLAQGKITEDELPRDVLTVLLRNEDRIELPPDVLLREMAFYLQAGSHSTSNSMAHAVHEIFTWCDNHPEERDRVRHDRLFVQRCVHESMRLHPASPVAWRRPTCPMSVGRGETVGTEDRVIIDLAAANRDRSIFGEDADRFIPGRPIPVGQFPFGLTFGTGVHACLGRDLDGGVIAKGDVDPAAHQYGLVTLLVAELLEAGAHPDPKDPPRPDLNTQRQNWGYYPVEFRR